MDIPSGASRTPYHMIGFPKNGLVAQSLLRESGVDEDWLEHHADNFPLTLKAFVEQV